MADDLDPAAVARAAEAMSDYLTMLGVDPDDVGEGVAAGTTAHVLARAALAAARDGEADPQPAQPSPCQHCPDGHADPTTLPWGVYVAAERDGDGQPIRLHVMPADGAHVAESDAVWVRQRLNEPAVPTVTTEQAQQDAWTAAVAAYPTEHVGYDKPVPSTCQCDECYRREAQRDAYMAGRLDALGVEVRKP